MRDFRPQAEKSRFEKVLQAFAQTKVGGSLFISVLPAIDRRLIPLTRGNLRADRDVEVTIEGRRVPMRADVAQGEERERLWAIACDNYSGFATYQLRAGERVIPVVTLRPRAQPLPA
jgi:hypothetical protein